MSWPRVKLGEVATINPRPPRDADESQQVTFVAMASASEDGYLLGSESRALSETRKGFTYFDKNDVLLAKITPCFENGKCLRPGQIPTEIGFGSTEFHVIRPNPERLDGFYLFYLIWNEQFRFLGEKSMSGAAGQRRVGSDFLKGFEIPLPPLPEQKRIAAILDKADAIRRKRQQATQLADDFLRAVFLDMFGDPEANPKGWPAVELGTLIVKGPTNGIYKHASEYGGGTRILRIDGFYDGRLVNHEKMKRVSLSSQEIEKFKLEERSIVINRVNSREYLGKSAFISGLMEDTVFESNMMNFSVDESVLNPMFLVELLRTTHIKNQILSSAKDAVNQSSINQQDVKSLRILLPPPVLQVAFEKIVNEFEALAKKSTLCEGDMDDLFLSLSHKAFSGQL